MSDTYRVQANNTAKDSENKMHDDTVAKQYGFAGGLVTGVDLLAYMLHVPVAVWGRDFLTRGRIDAKFVKPVYDGDRLAIERDGSGDAMALRLVSRGEVCAQGQASLSPVPPPVDLAQYRVMAPDRRPLDGASFHVDQWLGTEPAVWNAADAAAYLRDIRDPETFYASDRLVHPGVIQRLMNRVLVENVVLGPWIHVGSVMQLLSPVRIDDVLTARARVTANYDKKGHRFAEFDAVVVANGERAVAHCAHTAIYAPRVAVAA